MTIRARTPKEPMYKPSFTYIIDSHGGVNRVPVVTDNRPHESMRMIMAQNLKESR